MEDTKFLEVIDSSAVEFGEERTHDIILNGEIISVTFKFGKKTILPFEQGVKFMKDGFVILDVDGDSLNIPAVASDNVSSQIGYDECVAKYSELTFSALKLRAAQKVGGEIYLKSKAGDTKNIISFLSGEAPETSLIDEENWGEYESIPNTIDGEENLIDDSEDVYNTETVDEKQDNTETAEKTNPETKEQEETFTIDEVKKATDEALELAVKHEIDINTVIGTGAKGNILKRDIEKIIATTVDAPTE